MQDPDPFGQVIVIVELEEERLHGSTEGFGFGVDGGFEGAENVGEKATNCGEMVRGFKGIAACIVACIAACIAVGIAAYITACIAAGIAAGIVACIVAGIAVVKGAVPIVA